MNILLFGSYRDGHEILLNMQHKITLFIPRNKYLPSDLDKGYLHYFCYDPSASDEAILSFCNHLHYENPYDCVISFNDDDHKLASKVSVLLGIFNIQDKNDLSLVKNKFLVRTLLREKKIPSCEFFMLENSEAADDLKPTHYPVIIKPVNGSASKNVVKVEDIEQYEKHLKNTSIKNFPLIVESFLKGNEYSVESISVKGKHNIIAITEKIKNPTTFVETGHIIPARITVAEQEKVNFYVARVLDSVGLMNGPAHTEIILTSTGPVLVETQFRTGGDFIIDLIKKNTGINIYDLQVKQCLGFDIEKSIPEKIEFNNFSAIAFSELEFSEDKTVYGFDTSNLSSDIDIKILQRLPFKLRKIESSSDRLLALISNGDHFILENLKEEIKKVVYILKEKEVDGDV